MARSIRKMTTRQKRNMENTFKIFDAVRCVNKNEKRFILATIKFKATTVYIYI